MLIDPDAIMAAVGTFATLYCILQGEESRGFNQRGEHRECTVLRTESNLLSGQTAKYHFDTDAQVRGGIVERCIKENLGFEDSV